MLVVAPHIQIPPGEFEFTFVRSSGPGGQNVNKVNSKAVLRWNPGRSAGLPEAVLARFRERYGGRLTTEGDLIVTSDRFRDQGRNSDDCLEKVREMLAAVAVAPKKRRPTKPSRAAKRRRLESKRRDSDKKQSRRSLGD